LSRRSSIFFSASIFASRSFEISSCIFHSSSTDIEAKLAGKFTGLLANSVEQLLETPALAIQHGELLVQFFNAAAQKLGTPLVA
jgi:hypothetical protein